LSLANAKGIERMNRKYLVAIGIVAILVVALVVVIPMITSGKGSTVGNQAAGTTQQAPPLAPGATMPANHPAVTGVTVDSSQAAAAAAASAEQLVKSAEDAYKANPTNVTSVLALADAYFQAQRLDDSTRLFNEALALEAKNSDARAGLAMIEYSKGNQQQAEATLQQIAQEDPRSQTALYDLAIIYFSSNLRDKAKATWQQAAAIDPGTSLGQMAQQFVDLMTARDAGSTSTSAK
jgi:cytochrome c-type biogenesis protein CcmH/NrfG